MQVRIEWMPEKKLVGLNQKMSFKDDKTYDLWHRFMPRRKEISNPINSDLLSLQFYEGMVDSDDFDVETIYEKWAVVEVPNFDNVPVGMQTLTVCAGEYAVFLYKGLASQSMSSFQYIFGEWLPSSAYTLDGRAHFEVLGAKYNKDYPDSEEEIWIPIQNK